MYVHCTFIIKNNHRTTGLVRLASAQVTSAFRAKVNRILERVLEVGDQAQAARSPSQKADADAARVGVTSRFHGNPRGDRFVAFRTDDVAR